jgi:hypothetical protein
MWDAIGRVWKSKDGTPRNGDTVNRAKGLSQRLGEQAMTKKRTSAGRNRVAFLAVREEIRSALDDGWTVKAIWTKLREEGAIEFGYDAFIRYVDRLVGSSKSPEPTPVPKPQSEATDKHSSVAKVEDSTGPKKTNGVPGFHFQPSLRKEDLI